MYDAILVPTDGRENTARAIDEAIDLAKTHDATLHALYVINSAAVAPGIDFDDLESVGQDAVEHVSALASEAGVKSTETYVTPGVRHRAILNYAARHDIDVIVMGQRKGIERYFTTGVSDQVAEEASIPILVVT